MPAVGLSGSTNSKYTLRLQYRILLCWYQSKVNPVRGFSTTAGADDHSLHETGIVGEHWDTTLSKLQGDVLHAGAPCTPCTWSDTGVNVWQYKLLVLVFTVICPVVSCSNTAWSVWRGCEIHQMKLFYLLSNSPQLPAACRCGGVGQNRRTISSSWHDQQKKVYSITR